MGGRYYSCVEIKLIWKWMCFANICIPYVPFVVSHMKRIHETCLIEYGTNSQNTHRQKLSNKPKLIISCHNKTALNSKLHPIFSSFIKIIPGVKNRKFHVDSTATVWREQRVTISSRDQSLIGVPSRWHDHPSNL